MRQTPIMQMDCDKSRKSVEEECVLRVNAHILRESDR